MTAQQHTGRAGRLIGQPTGYSAFIPTPLSPDPPLNMDMDSITLLANAATALGRLDGVAATLPNPDLFVAMCVRRKAVLSSQIEGTQSSLDDVLAFEANPETGRTPADVTEVINYVRAMNHGLHRMETLPLSLRLLREIHAVLLDGARGSEKSPGEFRVTQNWIGVGPRGLQDAVFVPPPPQDLMAHLSEFETIHPFLDGNGRMGRLLITLLLCRDRILIQPLLYLSHYLKVHRSEYYDRLMAVRVAGDWEGWLRFFLTGVLQVAIESESTARRIVELREEARAGARSSLERPHTGPSGSLVPAARGQRVRSARASPGLLRRGEHLDQRAVRHRAAGGDHWRKT